MSFPAGRGSVSASRFQFQSQFGTRSLHNTSFIQYMYNIGFDIIQQPLIVRNDDTTCYGSFQFVHRPVIVYGITAAFVYGIILFVISLFGG